MLASRFTSSRSWDMLETIDTSRLVHGIRQGQQNEAGEESILGFSKYVILLFKILGLL